MYVCMYVCSCVDKEKKKKREKRKGSGFQNLSFTEYPSVFYVHANVFHLITSVYFHGCMSLYSVHESMRVIQIIVFVMSSSDLETIS